MATATRNSRVPGDPHHRLGPRRLRRSLRWLNRSDARAATRSTRGERRSPRRPQCNQPAARAIRECPDSNPESAHRRIVALGAVGPAARLERSIAVRPTAPRGHAFWAAGHRASVLAPTRATWRSARTWSAHTGRQALVDLCGVARRVPAGDGPESSAEIDRAEGDVPRSVLSRPGRR